MNSAGSELDVPPGSAVSKVVPQCIKLARRPFLATTRVIEAGGLGGKAAIEWSDAQRRKAGLGSGRQEIEAIRERWAVLTNERLLAHGIRIDHRSLEAQRVEREPAVVGLERRGVVTEVGKRVEREALAAGQRRLERAAELGRVEREGRVLAVSIVDVSCDLAAAKRERERLLARERGGAGRTGTRPVEYAGIRQRFLIYRGQSGPLHRP